MKVRASDGTGRRARTKAAHPLAGVEIHVPLPEGAQTKQVSVAVTPRSLTVGLKGRPPYLRGELLGVVHADELIWTVEGGMLKIDLTKANPLDRWPGAVRVPDGWRCKW